MNYHLLRRGFPLTIINVQDRADDLTSLDEADRGNVKPFALLVLAAISRTIEKLTTTD